MNKLLRLSVTSLFISTVTFSLPLLANQETSPLIKDENSKTSPSINEKEAPSSDIFRLRLQHRINGGEPLPLETVDIPIEKVDDNPFVILKALEQNFSKQLEQQKKPVQIDTKLTFLLPTKVSQVLGTLPNVSFNTQVDKDGKGKSLFVFPAYRREVPKKVDGGALIDWKGLNGQLNFIEQFKNLNLALNIAELVFKKNEEFTASLGKTTLSGAFDANWAPIQMALNLPSWTAREDDNNRMNLQNVAFNFATRKTNSGLSVGDLTFKIGHFDLADGNIKAQLDNLVVTTEGKEQDGILNYTLQTQIGRVFLPKTITLTEDLDMSYTGNITFRRLDVEALMALQTIMHKVKPNKTALMPLMMQFMAVGPKFLSRSPEIALTDLSIKTPNGSLQGQASVNINKNKATSLFDIGILLSALEAQFDLSIGKKLLEQSLIAHVSLLIQQTQMGQKMTPEQLTVLQQKAKAASQRQIQMFLALKWLVEADENTYKVVADFKDKKLNLNGQEIGLPLP
jgi:hypothetical protein